MQDTLKNKKNIDYFTSIKYKVERNERYLPYIELGRWLCSHFQLETPLNFHKPITQKLYNVEQRILHKWIPWVPVNRFMYTSNPNNR